MEKRNGSVFTALTLLISDIAMLGAAFMVFGSTGRETALSIGVWQWLALAVLEFVLYRLFLRRERTLIQAAAFLAAAYIATVAVMLVFFVDFPSLLSTIIAVLFWAVPQWRIYTTAETPPAPEKLTLRLDMIIIVLLIALIYIIGTGKPFILALPCVSSLFLCLASLIVIRTTGSSSDDGGKIRGAAAIIAFLLLTGLVIAVFLLFAAASFGDAVAIGAAALMSGIKYIFALIMRILVWIASLIPEPDYSGDIASNVMAPAMDAPGEMEFIDAGPTALIVILCTIAAAIAVFVVVAVARYRRKTLGGKRVLKTTAVKRRALRVRPSLTRRVYSAAKFIVYSILYRNTPQGVFVRLERWGRTRRCGRAPTETQRSYLTRLSAGVPEHKDALASLANALDARWYGGRPASELSRRELVKLRRAFLV